MEIKDLLNETGIHLLALTETKLDNLIFDGSLAIDGYQFLKRNRNGHGGGIVLYFKDCLVCKVRNDLCSPYIEDLWVEICRPKARKMLLGIFYCPPSANKDYMTHVCDSWDRATDENYETYILGDFNKNWFNQEDSALLRLYTDICGLTQTVTEATRTVNTAHSATTTCLGLIFTNNPEQNMSNCKVISVGFTDHDLTVLSIKSKIPRGPSKVVYKRS